MKKHIFIGERPTIDNGENISTEVKSTAKI